MSILSPGTIGTVDHVLFVSRGTTYRQTFRCPVRVRIVERDGESRYVVAYVGGFGDTKDVLHRAAQFSTVGGSPMAGARARLLVDAEDFTVRAESRG